MLTEWLQPIPEKNYRRVLYIGKLQLVNKDGSSKKNVPTLNEMIEDIWQVASVFNRDNFISGHLSCSSTFHVVQLLEGKKNVVLGLMKRIRKDPRVVICKEFVKEQLTMQTGWSMSMCYSFKITSGQLGLLQDADLTIEDMFNIMKNTYEVEEDLPGFYKEIVETILLKYISITENEKIKPLRRS